MKSILAIDTSGELCSIALLNGKQLKKMCIESPRQHSQILLPLIDSILTEQKVTLNELDAIAYGCGPGSFTGLRICLGVVQGLGFSADIPVVPVSTLETMAQTVLEQETLEFGSRILVALDARMNEVYWCLYEVIFSNSGDALALHPVTDEQVSSAATVVDCLTHQITNPDSFVMAGPGCHYPELSVFPASKKLESIVPLAEHMLGIARRKMDEGSQLRAEDARPVYLRDNVAWKKRQRIRTDSKR